MDNEEKQINENLPQKKKNGIFKKIKSWFKNLFKKEEVILNEIDKQVEEIKKNDFKGNLQAESKDRILALQRKIKEKKVEISDLTDEELDEIIELYKKQIETKKEKLKQYRDKIIKK